MTYVAYLKSAEQGSFYSRNELTEYFRCLPDQEHFFEQIYKDNWSAFMEHDLTGFDLSQMLYKTAIALKNKRVLAPGRIVQSFIQDHITQWEEKARIARHTFNARDLSISAWATGVMGIKHSSAFLEHWHTQYQANVGNAIQINHRNGLWAMAVQDLLGAGEYALQAALDIHSHIRADNDIRGSQQNSDSCLWFDLPLVNDIPDQTPRKSEWEERLADIFRTASMPVSSHEGWVGGIKHNVDIAFNMEGHRFLIECDGPVHFLGMRSSDTAYIGNTLLRSALTHKFSSDACLIRIRYVDEAALVECSRIKGLKDMFLRGVENSPNVYETYSDDDGHLRLKRHLPERMVPASKAGAAKPTR